MVCSSVKESLWTSHTTSEHIRFFIEANRASTLQRSKMAFDALELRSVADACVCLQLRSVESCALSIVCIVSVCYIGGLNSSTCCRTTGHPRSRHKLTTTHHECNDRRTHARTRDAAMRCNAIERSIRLSGWTASHHRDVVLLLCCCCVGATDVCNSRNVVGWVDCFDAIALLNLMHHTVAVD